MNGSTTLWGFPLAVAALRLPSTPDLPSPIETLGLADLARMVFRRENLQPVWDRLLARATSGPPNPAAMLDLSNILQLVGQREQGLALQADALKLNRLYRRVLGDGDGPVVLALMAAGDMMANTPLEFLLQGFNGRLDLMYLDPAAPLPKLLPPHDLAVMAVGESDENAPLLAQLAGAMGRWPRPLLNGAPAHVLALGRDRAPQRLEGVAEIDAPPTRRARRAELMVLAQDDALLQALLPGRQFPLIVRPVGSHAGAGLARIERAADLGAYLAGQPGEMFYISPFVDYSSRDGLYRKLRIAMIDGQPFVAHMAISDHWMVHYLNAGMADSPARRAEEAAMMATFDIYFARRHAEAFRQLGERIGLDYFAIDCAEDQDSRLLIFEADTAMIIHDMDPPDLYPYKGPAMAELFAAFQELVRRRASAAA
jgi:hypothetical protein